MHESCREWVEMTWGHRPPNALPPKVVEFGSQNVNGGVRDICKTADYTGLDLVEGPGVDYVYDGVTLPEHLIGQANVVICTNVLEHVEDAQSLVNLMHSALKPSSGFLILQAAGPGFQPHSGRSESLTLEPDEFYRNVQPWMLEGWLQNAGFSVFGVEVRTQWPFDIYATGYA